MSNTYYDSQLTAAEIEAALEAIDGVITPANNGKVLAIENGGIVAKDVSEYTDVPVLVSKSISANGNYDPASDDADGYSSVVVNVPNSYAAGDEGKVVSNGALVAQTSATKTQNGTYDTTMNNEIVVDVQGGGSAVIEPLSVNQNGTYTAPSGVDGYSPVTVNVSGGGGSKTLLYEFNQTQGSRWIDTEVSVSGINTFLFEDVQSDDVKKTILVDVSEIAVYTGGADVYTTIYRQNGKDMNARIYNGNLYVSYNGTGSSSYVTKIYKLNWQIT